jgi:hypothetical protein
MQRQTARRENLTAADFVDVDSHSTERSQATGKVFPTSEGREEENKEARYVNKSSS